MPSSRRPRSRFELVSTLIASSCRIARGWSNHARLSEWYDLGDLSGRCRRHVPMSASCAGNTGTTGRDGGGRSSGSGSPPGPPPTTARASSRSSGHPGAPAPPRRTAPSSTNSSATAPRRHLGGHRPTVSHFDGVTRAGMASLQASAINPPESIPGARPGRRRRWRRGVRSWYRARTARRRGVGRRRRRPSTGPRAGNRRRRRGRCP